MPSPPTAFGDRGRRIGIVEYDFAAARQFADKGEGGENRRLGEIRDDAEPEEETRPPGVEPAAREARPPRLSVSKSQPA